MVLTSPVRGGVEEVALSLARSLPRHGIRPALSGPATLLEEMGGELREAGIETFAVAADSWLPPRPVAGLAACLRRFRPDIVNPHLFRSTFVAAPLSRWLGIPAVVETYHGREAWRRGLLRGSFVVDRVVSRCVDRVIAVSEAARDFLVTTKKIAARKVVVIPNGRDLSVYRPSETSAEVRRELGVPDDVPLIAVVGRLEPQKGHSFALGAFGKVAREIPEARLLIVGEGSLRGALEGTARADGLAPRVIFTGFRSDVPRILGAVDLVVLPSLYEGMPLTAIEACAMAKPLVATAVDGTAEVVQDGTTGILVPAADASALGDAILRLLRDPESRRRMGKAGRQRVLERFDLERQVEATAEVYRDVAGGRAGAR